MVDNGLENLWRRENPDLPEFTRYNRSFGKDPRSSSPQLQRRLFLLKTQKTTTLQQVTGGNTPNIV